MIAQFRDDEVLIRLNELNWQQDVSQLQNGLNTARREAEVISYGKLNSDMSDFLAISPRTVQKHFERI